MNRSVEDSKLRSCGQNVGIPGSGSERPATLPFSPYIDPFGLKLESTGPLAVGPNIDPFGFVPKVAGPLPFGPHVDPFGDYLAKPRMS